MATPGQYTPADKAPQHSLDHVDSLNHKAGVVRSRKCQGLLQVRSQVRSFILNGTSMVQLEACCQGALQKGCTVRELEHVKREAAEESLLDKVSAQGPCNAFLAQRICKSARECGVPEDIVQDMQSKITKVGQFQPMKGKLATAPKPTDKLLATPAQPTVETPKSQNGELLTQKPARPTAAKPMPRCKPVQRTAAAPKTTEERSQVTGQASGPQNEELPESKLTEAMLSAELPLHYTTLGLLLQRLYSNPTSCQKVLELVLPDFSRYYAPKPNAGSYGLRGGHEYYKPSGWLRFAVRMRSPCEDWCVAYHGTCSQNMLSILTAGLLRPGGPARIRVAHGQAYSTSQRTIYLSPAIEYSAFPVYAEFVEIAPDHWAQLVLQCRVRPGSFTIQKGTLGNKYWPNDSPFDPNFSGLDGLEWLVESEQDVVVSALLVREFGPYVNPVIFGDLATQVRQTGQGPQFHWTALRKQDMQQTYSNAAPRRCCIM
ncbi:unnamed protein product [Effrenium voratum]|nr:unnamed protein product [Effrenium voratum]